MKAKGKVALDSAGKRWIIECEPHVMQRLKRIFEGIPKQALGRCPLADTPTNADELRWFLSRFPLEMSAVDRLYLDSRADAAVQRQSIVEHLLDEDYVPRNFALALPPRDYQRFAADLALQQGYLLLADDTGLGKTVSTICVLSDPTARPAIVVCSPNILPQWEAQIGRFLPSAVVYVCKTTKPTDLTVGPRGTKLPFPDVVLITYNRLVGWAETLCALERFQTIAYDEVQAFRRRFNSQKELTHRYAAGLYIRDRVRLKLGCSATPIYNYGGEIHNVISVLDADAVGTREEFCRDWCEGSTGENARVADPKVLGHYLRSRGVMIRRTTADVGRELPKLTTIVHPIDTDGVKLGGDRGGVTELAKRILRRGVSGIDKMADGRELDARVRHQTGVAKAPAVAAFIRILVEEGRKVVLFGWHKSVYRIWQEHLHDLGIVFFTGDQSQGQKQAAIEAFTKSPAHKVIAISLRAAEGLDGLQYVTSTVVFGELDASPKVMTQDIARVNRDGQVNPVQAYVIVSDQGSDPVYLDILGLKTAQSDGVMDPTKDVVEEQLPDDKIQKLAESWLEQYDPHGLAQLRAENAAVDAQKEADKAAAVEARVEAKAARKKPTVTAAPVHLPLSPAPIALYSEPTPPAPDAPVVEPSPAPPAPPPSPVPAPRTTWADALASSRRRASGRPARCQTASKP